MQSPLLFNMNIGTQKPESIRNTATKCPFCDRESLTDILEEKGDIIWLKNKYPVLADAFQTVLIETKDCFSELSEYSKDHLYTLIDFGLQAWEKTIESGDYKSVIFFKNHGPFSGGTLRHPHMQIIGFKEADYHENISASQFEGLPIDQQYGIEFNISTKPKMGFYELNILMKDRGKTKELADYIQLSTHFLLNHFNKNCSSYNLFFYRMDETIIAKVVPRFAASPLYVGYSFPQVASNIDAVAEKIKSLYL
ncbi:DUF4931 domain-containing protein [Fictibacillus sp. S7]|uniref:Galactose-1-phosphate uridylyltransferase n=2 Tax=Fictibacillus TaxID=1329200 RepID=A0A0V8J861_9BACL|nr:DUF4931 domain-containing protein [Fictibacillus enclensis]KSU83327.1 galactose-1-phosphate uridylyltransferase [Fictibacillus enclensis]RXZ02072.1 DUF4931 domain-containing protein [Fictibacillus sp. S7]SCC13672.1 Galactose-1-phosphate uridylyltransferase [Fictibacillus enclensis]